MVAAPLVRGNVAREGGNNLSLHITFPLAGTELGFGTLVPEDCVSTHPRGEEEGRRDLFFIGALVGTSEGMNDASCLVGDGGRGVLVKRGLEEGSGSGISE